MRALGRRPHRGRDRATQPRLNPSQSPEAPGGTHPDSYTVPPVETQEAIHACMRAAQTAMIVLRRSAAASDGALQREPTGGAEVFLSLHSATLSPVIRQ